MDEAKKRTYIRRVGTKVMPTFFLIIILPYDVGPEPDVGDVAGDVQSSITHFLSLVTDSN